MGGSVSRLFGKVPAKRDVRVLMVGLEGAGKATILYRLSLDMLATTPTLIPRLKTIEYRNIKFTTWDIDCQGCRRPRTSHDALCLQDASGVVFVVDANDKDRIGWAKRELQRLLSEDELRDACLLVLASKQDLPNAMSTAEVADKLGLQSMRQREWYIQGTCSTSPYELSDVHQGLDWMVEACSNQKHRSRSFAEI
eukprot:TRINITY_DN16880_c0_g1_i1.p1 TRINITY_DN16880_c0_g1~~TRINITY_DN16880_c0_g1_i1.p1  ORF type:complete len:214 (+),score=44.34 TRINITY_DN16880_c0_g1_i1:56-643(+)